MKKVIGKELTLALLKGSLLELGFKSIKSKDEVEEIDGYLISHFRFVYSNKRHVTIKVTRDLDEVLKKISVHAVNGVFNNGVHYFEVDIKTNKIAKQFIKKLRHTLPKSINLVPAVEFDDFIDWYYKYNTKDYASPVFNYYTQYKSER